MSIVDFDRSLEIERAIGAVPKACRSNALRGLEWLEKNYEGNFYYVEGYLTLSDMPIPIEHGWIEDRTFDYTQVIDPTLAGRPGFINQRHYYFAGHSERLGGISGKDRKAILKENHAIVFNYGFGGNKHEGYMRALQDCMNAIQGGL